MKRTISLFAILSLLSLAVGIADASYQDKYELHEHDPGDFAVPPPPGKSLWCTRNPKRCYPYNDEDKTVETRCEACMDRYCNGDGYIARWEIRHARKLCSVCN